LPEGGTGIATSTTAAEVAFDAEVQRSPWWFHASSNAAVVVVARSGLVVVSLFADNGASGLAADDGGVKSGAGLDGPARPSP
jgi:hypothetical protein